MKRNFLTALLALTLLLCSCGPATGGGNSSSQPAQTPSSSTAASSEAAPVDSDPVPVTWMITMDLATNKSWTTENVPKLLQNHGFNVTFEVMELGSHNGTDWSDMFNTKVASGEMPPDIIQLGGMNLPAVDAGWFAELSIEQIQENMPQYYEAAIGVYDKMTAYFKDPRNGKVYGVSSWNMFGSNRHTFVYRKDWLDQLGMGVPETIDEFEEFLRACRTVEFGFSFKYPSCFHSANLRLHVYWHLVYHLTG